MKRLVRIVVAIVCASFAGSASASLWMPASLPAPASSDTEALAMHAATETNQAAVMVPGTPCPHAAMATPQTDHSTGHPTDLAADSLNTSDRDDACNAVGTCCLGAFVQHAALDLAVARMRAEPAPSLTPTVRDAASPLLLRPPILEIC